jgi:hypothetical protein
MREDGNMPTCKLFKTNHNTGYNNLGKKKGSFWCHNWWLDQGFGVANLL